jgi:nicotinate phosphoribosyltransferase
VTVDLVREVRARLDQAGFPGVGIYVSGGMDAERVAEFVSAGAPVDSFGIGMAISSAPPIGFTADIKEVEGRPWTKRGRIPGLMPNQRLRRVL